MNINTPLDNGSAVHSANINPSPYLDAQISITESAFDKCKTREEFYSLMNLELAIATKAAREHYLAEYDRRNPATLET